MSATKKVLTPVHAITNGSMGGDLTTAVFGPQYMDNIGIQVKWSSSTAVGVIAVAGSLNNSDFYNLTFTPALAQPNSDSSGYLININQIPYPYFKVTYTKTSGTGTLNVWVTMREI